MGGLLFEKRLIEKLIRETGKCPISKENISPDDLIPIKKHKFLRPRDAPAASIPGLLSLFRNEWDAIVLENYQLKQQLTLNRQELAHALYQHDAATLVISRLIKERNDVQNAFLASQNCITEIKEKKRNSKNSKVSNYLSDEVINLMVEKSINLSSKRKKYKTLHSLITTEILKEYRYLLLPTSSRIIVSDTALWDDIFIVFGGNNGHLHLFDRMQWQSFLI